MNLTEPSTEQAIAYFRDMANGKAVSTASERPKGAATYHVTTPADQVLAQAYEAVERQKVIRGPQDGQQSKEVIKGLTAKGPVQLRKTLKAATPGKRVKKLEEYPMPGLN